VSGAAVALREGRPQPRSEKGRWEAIRSRLGIDWTADLVALQMLPSKVCS
jgi:hypothetical protein